MKLLIEELVIPPDLNSKYNKMDGRQKADFIYKEIFANPSTIKNNKLIQAIKKDIYREDLVDSIINKGWESNSNPFLAFMINNKNNFIMNKNQAKLIRSLLESNYIKPDLAFLYEPTTYNSTDFKIKTLAFLHSADAKKYGSDVSNIINEVKNERDERKIKNLITSWQSKDPSEDDSVDNKLTGAQIIKKALGLDDSIQIGIDDITNYIEDLLKNNKNAKYNWSLIEQSKILTTPELKKKLIAFVSKKFGSNDLKLEFKDLKDQFDLDLIEIINKYFEETLA